MYKDYFTYLYGLPMKLRDPGTLIDPKVVQKTKNGTDYWVLKVTYEPEVGSDTWYFYFDQSSYALKQYQFFHEESKNDGEYIILEDEINIAGIKMPKNRSWYYNSDDTFLGKDILTNKKQIE
jgi:predicted membrane-bound dolichyl-phosphate-mannose-protein mannosyltransferase